MTFVEEEYSETNAEAGIILLQSLAILLKPLKGIIVAFVEVVSQFFFCFNYFCVDLNCIVLCLLLSLTKEFVV